MTYIFAKLVQNLHRNNNYLRKPVHSKITQLMMNFIQDIIQLFFVVSMWNEKPALVYSMISLRQYEKKPYPDYHSFLEFISSFDTPKTFFNRTIFINKMKRMIGWFEPFPIPQYSIISIPSENLVLDRRLLGYLGLSWQLLRLLQSQWLAYTGLFWQFLRFQWQRWSCFNAHWGNLWLKRLLDIVISATLLILLSPCLSIIALLIYIDSPGPIFFFQRRVGKQGQAFTMWKFRSMHMDAEKHKAILMKDNEMNDGILFKMKNDPRITRTGKFLRKFSIDEIPQLFNVLIGEMSLVGPRPPLPNEVAKYSPYHRQRLEVTPGITCFWQISGRNEIPFPKQVELDLHYITTQSFIGDITLLLKTVPAVIKGHGAY